MQLRIARICCDIAGVSDQLLLHPESHGLEQTHGLSHARLVLAASTFRRGAAATSSTYTSLGRTSGKCLPPHAMEPSSIPTALGRLQSSKPSMCNYPPQRLTPVLTPRNSSLHICQGCAFAAHASALHP